MSEAIKTETSIRKKRKIQRAPSSPTEMYISRKSNFHALVLHANCLFTTNKTLSIKAMGPAISTAIKLAMHLKATSLYGLTHRIETGTVLVVDDIYPADVDQDIGIETRRKSVITIHVDKFDAIMEHVITAEEGGVSAGISEEHAKKYKGKKERR